MAQTPDPQQPAVEYLACVVSSMKETLAEFAANPDGDLPINLHALEVKRSTFSNDPRFEFSEQVLYDVEEGWAADPRPYVFTITTGGPHAELITTDSGESWLFHYHDWFMQDATDLRLFGEDLRTVQAVFNEWFEVMM